MEKPPLDGSIAKGNRGSRVLAPTLLRNGRGSHYRPPLSSSFTIYWAISVVGKAPPLVLNLPLLRRKYFIYAIDRSSRGPLPPNQRERAGIGQCMLR